MKDIKSLYLTAKTSGRAEDISAYEECVKYLLENKPNDYISNLEYIISSSISLKTWNEFVERYGLPIACYDNAIACFESCIEKCNSKEKDASVYTELKSRLESFRDNHIGCFMMYEYYSDLDSNEYVSTYYGFTESGVQNSKLLSGMIKKYGEAAVPDILINSEKMGAKVVTQALKFLENHETLNGPLFYQYLSEAVSNIDEGIIDNEIKGYIESIESKSASAIITINKTRNQSVYRESIIMGEQNACVFAYTESELNAIQDMITFNEFKLTFLENTEDILKLQNEIYSLYEEFDGILEESGTANINDTIKKAFEDKVKNKLKNASVMKISDLDDWDTNPVDDKKQPNEPMKIVIFDEDVADSIIPMLPSANNGTLKTEAPYHVNTRNKKTGEVPAYLGRNHDLGYGEDDGKPLGLEDNDEPSLDDYRRKSIDNPKSNSVPEIQDIGGDIEDEDSDKGNLQDKKDMSAVNNYYYYTYNNSLNKNANSFNRDYSRRDDHSVSSTTHTTDDHSTNKGDNRGNSEVHSHYEKESTFNPCELDVPGNEKVFAEGFKDLLKKGINKIKGLIGIKKSLANLQNLDIPSVSSRRVPLTIIGTNIPIDMKNNIKTESVDDINTTSDLQYLLENGYVITEDVSDSFLSKNDVKNIINNLRSKFKAEILFISPNNNAEILSQIGPAAVIQTDRNTINKLISGKTIDKLKSPLYGDSGDFDTVILVNSKLIRDFNIKEPKDLELIISHEYGHVLTFDQLTLDDWTEYSIKRQTMTSIVQGLYLLDDIKKATAEMNLFYHKLKPEVLANKAVNINPSDLINGIFKYKPTGKLDKVDLDVIVNWNIPPIIINISKSASKGNDIKNSDMIAVLNSNIELFKTCVKDKEFLDNVINSLNLAISSYSESSVNESIAFTEEVGDVDDNKPVSDHPVKDVLTDIDRKLTKKQQAAKKAIQNVQNTGRIFIKPAVRTSQWINKMVMDWKDNDETKIKERMADPHARNNLFAAISAAIKAGSLAKAGLLFNPIFLFLTITRGLGRNKKLFRIRNEMIGEIDTEINIIKEKIRDADRAGDNKAKYQLMRLENELKKKLLRVGGGKDMKKII